MKAKKVVSWMVDVAQKFDAGDKISFRDRGKTVVGTIARVRLRERRKVSKMLAAHGIDADLAKSMVAEINPEGGEGVYTVPLTLLTMVKKGGGDATAARQEISALRGRYQDQLSQRKSSRFSEISQGRLVDLRPGSAVLCQFRGGLKWERKFRRITPSGKVEVETDCGRIEKHDPKFVTKM